MPHLNYFVNVCFHYQAFPRDISAEVDHSVPGSAVLSSLGPAVFEGLLNCKNTMVDGKVRFQIQLNSEFKQLKNIQNIRCTESTAAEFQLPLKRFVVPINSVSRRYSKKHSICLLSSIILTRSGDDQIHTVPSPVPILAFYIKPVLGCERE